MRRSTRGTNLGDDHKAMTQPNPALTRWVIIDAFLRTLDTMLNDGAVLLQR